MKLFLTILGSMMVILSMQMTYDDYVRGDTLNDDSLALIIVSGYSGYSNNEIEKASSFREYLLDNLFYQHNIRYLTKPDLPGADGEPTVGTIMGVFQWLQMTANASRDVVIYISDHAKLTDGMTQLMFNDGNISGETIDDLLDNVECASMRIVLTGARSGMGGAEVASPQRDVYCSMRSYQDYAPDEFDMARSLTNIQADSDHDGVVSFDEAFDRETDLLEDSGQSPIKFT